MSSKPLFRAVIFDFDGVIADTIPLHFASYREMFREAGVQFSFADYLRVGNGAARHEVVRATMGELPDDEKRRLMDRKGEIMLELVRRDGLQAIPGSLELVRRFRELGLKLGLASSSRSAVQFLESMGERDLFDAVTDALQTVKAKPDPEVYLATATKLGIPPENCLAIEDAILGVQSAHAAGMAVLAVTTTTTADDLKDADWVVESLTQVRPEKLLERG